MARGPASFPNAPSDWSPSSRDVWTRLILTLENSNLFDSGRRTRPQFVIVGTVSAATTLDMASPSVTALTAAMGQLLLALRDSNFIDVRTP